jgi:cutinase
MTVTADPYAPKIRRYQLLASITRTVLLAAGAGAVAATALTATPATAQAAPASCPDVEVLFARGTFETPGLGKVGDPFVDAVQSRLPGATVNSYAVDYPATLDFGRTVDGVADVSAHVRDVVTACPATRIVLGGYSQGAAVMGYTTMDATPTGYTLPQGITGPMPIEYADRIAAVALFGTPSAQFTNLVYRDAPELTIGSRFAGKTMQLCAAHDPVCEQIGLNRAAHSAYLSNGMIDQAADFVVRRLTHGASPSETAANVANYRPTTVDPASEQAGIR